jgi:hypothetical protein
MPPCSFLLHSGVMLSSASVAPTRFGTGGRVDLVHVVAVLGIQGGGPAPPLDKCAEVEPTYTTFQTFLLEGTQIRQTCAGASHVRLLPSNLLPAHVLPPQGATASRFKNLRRVLCGPPTAADVPLPDWLSGSTTVAVASGDTAQGTTPAPVPEATSPPSTGASVATVAGTADEAATAEAGAVALDDSASADPVSSIVAGTSTALQQLIATNGSVLNLIDGTGFNGSLNASNSSNASINGISGNITARSASGAAGPGLPAGTDGLLLTPLALALGLLAAL